MRQFADLAGISNPYLSQIGRGLRAPSERVLEGIATALKMSADTLLEQAGLSPRDEAPEYGGAGCDRSRQASGDSPAGGVTKSSTGVCVLPARGGARARLDGGAGAAREVNAGRADAGVSGALGG